MGEQIHQAKGRPPTLR